GAGRRLCHDPDDHRRPAAGAELHPFDAHRRHRVGAAEAGRRRRSSGVRHGLRPAPGRTMLQPIIRMAFMVFGQSPEPIFANLDRFFSMVTRGITFSWQPGDKGGSVLTRFDGEDTPEAAFHVLRGTLLLFTNCRERWERWDFR